MTAVHAVVCGDLNLLRCFAGSGIPTLVAVTSARDVTLRSRQCRERAIIAPPSQPELALRDLLALGKRLGGRPVLYYGTDAQLLLLSRNRAALEPHFRFRMPPPELIQQLVDKRLFANLAREHDLPVPSTVSSEEAPTADELERRLGLPCLFKPRTHIGWFAARAAHGQSPHKALCVRTRAELEQALRELAAACPEFVVQQYVPGGEENIYSYHAYLNEPGNVLGEFEGRKLRTYPKQAGVSTYLELIHEPELRVLGRSIAQRLALTGPVKLDFKRDAQSGRFYLLEINARYTLWNYLGASAGINLPQIAYADLTGDRVQPQRGYQTGVRWLSFGNDLRAFVRDYRRDGSLSTLAWLDSLRAPKVYEIFSWTDPLPSLTNAAQFSGRLLRKMAGRLRLGASHAHPG